jgi:hypothetical protein
MKTQGLSPQSGVGLCASSVRIQHIVNDVQNTVGDQYVRGEQLCRVDVDVVSRVEQGDGFD